jgi:hypothetical protein
VGVYGYTAINISDCQMGLLLVLVFEVAAIVIGVELFFEDNLLDIAVLVEDLFDLGLRCIVLKVGDE